MNCQITELPYAPCSTALFSLFAEQTWSVFLDSCSHLGTSGRYDFIAFDPLVRIQTLGDRTWVHRKTPPQKEIKAPQDDCPSQPVASGKTLFDVIKETMEPFERKVCQLLQAGTLPKDLPFYGGAMGHLGYGLRTPNTPTQLTKASHYDGHFGLFDCFIVVDHHTKKTRLIDLNLADLPPGNKAYSARSTRVVQRLKAQPNGTATPPFRLTEPFKLDCTRAQYQSQYRKIIDYIHAGDCYQVNLAQRLSASFSGDPWSAYLALRTVSPAPFSGFMRFPETTLLSHSPESFLFVREGKVTTQPIKGTRRRANDPVVDAQLKSELRASPKDQAENLMIVDLMRNDLGRRCQTGSIKVSRLFELQSFSNVHHLVSTVEGALAPECHPLDLLKEAFPGGSITGAPKRRAMEIIEELEPFPRGPYCGSLGYISFDGQVNTNIAIRTLYSEEAKLYCWGGGGVVADSNEDAEYQESLDKINNLTKTLNEV